jgi:glycosyltransferase involved in cell wall biosynthesis
MKVLVAAIACLPGGGSEASVGWAFVKQLAVDHEIFVLVSGRFRQGWDEAAAKGLVPSNIRARFVGNPRDHHPNRLIARLGTWREYLDFSSAILEQAEAWHREVGFDLVHQVTYATWRVPTPLWRMKLPVIWGPLAGAGRVPFRFYPSLGITGAAFEGLRELSGLKSYWSSEVRSALKECAVVIAANEETRSFLAPFRPDREIPVVSVAAIEEARMDELAAAARPAAAGAPLRLFAGGNMIASKGLILAIEALALVRDEGVGFHYLVAGGGPDELRAKARVRRLGLESQIEFHPGFRGDEYLKQLGESDVYFLPSFREAAGLTMIEAMLAGCVPVVGKISAPGEIVTRDCGIAVPVKAPRDFKRGLADAIVMLSRNRQSLPRFASAGEAKARHEFSASNQLTKLRGIYSGIGKYNTDGR